MPKMTAQNGFVDVSILDPPIQASSHHRKAISHAILYGIVSGFAGELSYVFSRCIPTLRSGFAAVRVRRPYHLFPPLASFEQ